MASSTARVFDVKHFAVHDGPGIRTTFFLMGCPLRCLWCQNPESQTDEQVITLNRSKCTACGKCAAACGRLDTSFQLLRRDCTLCGHCVSACPSGARAFGSELYTPQQIVDLVLPERIFFDTSGGGVTFSGGECLLHKVFLLETLPLLRNAGIHCTIDTCGAAPLSTLRSILPYVDLFLFDIKKMDSASHRKLTGAGNEQILMNLEHLCHHGAPVIIRVPLIPGLTDSESDMHAIGHYIQSVLRNRILRCELLPYNELAESKYGNKSIWSDYSLGEYPLPGLKTQDQRTLARLAEILASYGVSVYCESL